MYEMSRKNKDEVERNLKDFAFEQSPMFKQDTTRGMSMEYTFDLHDNWDDQLPDDIYQDIQDSEIINEDQTIVELGFDAKRLIDVDRRRPVYRFAARLVFNTVQRPYEATMSNEAWEEVAEDFGLDDDEDEPISKSEIIEMLTDNMINCQKYRRVDYDYDTREGVIHVNDESGYIIAGGPYGIIETHPLEYDFDEDIDEDTGESIAAESLDSDNVVDNIMFEETISQLRDEYNQSGDIMPHADKFNELNHLMKCLKSRHIPIR